MTNCLTKANKRKQYKQNGRIEHVNSIRKQRSTVKHNQIGYQLAIVYVEKGGKEEEEEHCS